MRSLILLIFFLLSFSTIICAQTSSPRYRKKNFQLSLAPGISTNGLASAHYFNKFSFNLFGGISAGNSFLEIGGISNLNTNYANGIQLAGIANVVGSNAFTNLTLREERDLMKEGFSSDFQGIQLAGVVNVVRDNVSGIQIAGALNFNNGYGMGMQIGGLGNMVGDTYTGVQIGGLFNVAKKGMAGSQVSLLYNYTNGQMQGMQIALINKAARSKGKNSLPPVPQPALQIGLININKENAGHQVGLINISKVSNGHQIGLINIFKTAPSKHQEKGNTPIGLINQGSKGDHIRVYANELFINMVEITTGSCYNCSFTETEMPISDKYKTMNQNAIIVGYNWGTFDSEVKWAAGYGFEKVYYNKASVAKNKNNERYFVSSGLRLLHLNREKAFKPELNLLTKIHTEFGFRVRSSYLFAGISLNLYTYKNDEIELVRNKEIFQASQDDINFKGWLGYTVGIQL
ncbi:hypothetical protein [Fulvivirga ligni]|uniref:hypothetical protein n=1 Tax=Fulvivirga ligni TaxID=2904246 RepID=UPI001F1911D0|nr:hypothetical protein [Fulvivirga ligni]UII22279.1 hypothetical protein LVD16_03420 [Fulvivirga ligni]